MSITIGYLENFNNIEQPSINNGYILGVPRVVVVEKLGKNNQAAFTNDICSSKMQRNIENVFVNVVCNCVKLKTN